MCFVLYELNSPQAWRAIRVVKLAGENGPFATFVRSCVVDSFAHLEWRLSEAEIISLLGGEKATNCALALELESNRTGKNSRARIREVWGFSEADWTSVFMRMEISTETPDDDTPGMLDLCSRATETKTVYQLLHLNGGTVEQKWTWASNPGLNGPLLSQEALGFFMQSIGRRKLQVEEATSPKRSALRTPDKSRKRALESEAQAYVELCNELEALLESKREHALQQQYRSDADVRLHAEMCRDLERLLESTQEQFPNETPRVHAELQGTSAISRRLDLPKIGEKDRSTTRHRTIQQASIETTRSK